MIKHDRNDVSKRIDVNKTNESCKYIICSYYYFLKVNFRFQRKALMIVMINAEGYKL